MAVEFMVNPIIGGRSFCKQSIVEIARKRKDKGIMDISLLYKRCFKSCASVQ